MSKNSTMTKSQLVAEIAAKTNTTPKEAKAFLASLEALVQEELKKTGVFSLPGLCRFNVAEKPATEARSGIHPFTKKPCTFPAKPASKVVKARPVKALKDAVA